MSGRSRSTNMPLFAEKQPELLSRNQAADLRVALIHDWLTGMRGGEKVLEVLCKLFPQAPLFTLMHVRGSVSEVIEDRVITTSPLQHMPWSAKKYRHYLPLFPVFAELTKVRGYDLVISSSHAVAKAMVRWPARNRPFHICYIHTPMRYIWDRFDDYFGAEKVGRISSLMFFRPLAALLRFYDRRTADRVDVFCANSRYVAERVHTLYGRDAVVLHPPVDIERFSTVVRCAEDWYLVVSALVPYKRVDHAIAACAQLGRKLRIVGSGPEESRLRVLAKGSGANVEFLGAVTDDELLECYGRARALLFPGVEDFGIVPIEAIAAGCPVVALAEGGILDSMTDRTAFLYSKPTAGGLRQAIVQFEASRFEELELREHAQLFSIERFLEGFRELVDDSLKQWNAKNAAEVAVARSSH